MKNLYRLDKISILLVIVWLLWMFYTAVPIVRHEKTGVVQSQYLCVKTGWVGEGEDGMVALYDPNCPYGDVVAIIGNTVVRAHGYTSFPLEIGEEVTVVHRHSLRGIAYSYWLK